MNAGSAGVFRLRDRLAGGSGVEQRLNMDELGTGSEIIRGGDFPGVAFLFLSTPRIARPQDLRSVG